MTWEARLARAKRTGFFTPADKDSAGTWQTCALGEVCAKRRVKVRFAVNDGILYDLAMAFADAVSNDEVARAAGLYRKILQAVP